MSSLNKTQIFRNFGLIFNRMMRIASFTVVAVFLCFPTGLGPDDINKLAIPSSLKHLSALPLESFVFVEVHDSAYMTGNCDTADLECENESKLLYQTTINASGHVLQTLDESNTYILTAGHACDQNMATELVSPETLDGYINHTLVVTLHDYYGYPHVGKVLAVDREKDLCLIQSDNLWAVGQPLARHLPKIGNQVYNIAAPLGIFSPGNALIFTGYFSGIDQNYDAYFTLPSRPGSSGSAIFNEYGEIVAIVHSAVRNLEHLAIASPIDEIETFVYMHVPAVTSY